MVRTQAATQQQHANIESLGRSWQRSLRAENKSPKTVQTYREAVEAFDGFLAAQALAADGNTPFVNPLAPKKPHFTPKAKRVIFLYMYGGPSHIDTFDHKPAMRGMDGKTIHVKTFGRGGHKNQGRIVEPRWAFKQYGRCGKWVSDLFPHLAGCVDEIAFVHSMTADSPRRCRRAGAPVRVIATRASRSRACSPIAARQLRRMAPLRSSSQSWMTLFRR